MADNKKSPEELINELVSFIEYERELYGDFSTDLSDNPELNAEEDQGGNNNGNVVKEPATQNVTDGEQESQPSSSSDNMEPPKSQEGLFNQNESNEIYYKIKKCNSLEELEELCRQANVLRTDLEGTQLVFGVGNPDADLMLIGEAPGAEEDKQGEPFVGKAGQLLNKILDAINFKREDVYIANILKHRPPNNRNPKPEERERSLPFLLRQIDLINPKLILALGKVSAQTLLDKNMSLTKMRGQFHDFRGKYQLMATYHPAALLRHAKWKRPTWEDVQLLRKRYDELGGQP